MSLGKIKVLVCDREMGGKACEAKLLPQRQRTDLAAIRHEARLYGWQVAAEGGFDFCPYHADPEVDIHG